MERQRLEGVVQKLTGVQTKNVLRKVSPRACRQGDSQSTLSSLDEAAESNLDLLLQTADNLAGSVEAPQEKEVP